MAAGLQKTLTATEVAQLAKKIFPEIELLLKDTTAKIPEARACRCAKALFQASAT
jgi:hypothetical protein